MLQVRHEEVSHPNNSIAVKGVKFELVNPNTIWEKFTCHTCYRYLSVNPIRVYPNNTMRCGRCSKNDSDGIIASFGSITDQLIFKCINRFDGCKKLLSNNLVEEHEKNCLSMKYFCPLCPDKSLEIPTYALITHFKEQHKHNILEKPWIFVDLEDSCDVNKMLLYNIDDNLFFVTFKFNVKYRLIFLGALHVGSAERAKKIKQKFSLYANDDDLNLDTKLKSCDYFGSSSPDAFSLKRSEFQSNKFIILIELDLKEVELMKMPFSDVDSSEFGKFRKIFLSSNFLNSNPIYSIAATGSALVITENKSERVITFQCCICLVILRSSEIIVLESGRKSFCIFCVEYYKTKESNAQIKSFSVPQELADNLNFFCKWNCNGLIPYRTSVIQHKEEFCPLQPTKECPVERCTFKANPYKLVNHFKNSHRDANLYLNPTATIISWDKDEHIISCAHNNSLIGASTYPSLSQTPEVSAAEKKNCYYFLLDKKFVLLRQLEEKDKSIFSIEYCSLTDANGQLQPAVIVYNNKYIDTFRHNFVYNTSSGNGSFSVNVILEKVRP